ncbi:MAG: hypothetical protein ACPL2D_07460 [Ignavibacteria bacterium]
MKLLNLLSILTFFLALSCGNSDQKVSSEQKTNDTVSQHKQTEISSSSVNTQNNSKGELDLKKGLPNNFPNDISQPPEGQSLNYMTVSEKTIVTFEVRNHSVKEMIEFYKQDFAKKGYTMVEGDDQLVSDKGGIINWKKDNKEIEIAFSYNEKDKVVNVVITY